MKHFGANRYRGYCNARPHPRRIRPPCATSASLSNCSPLMVGVQGRPTISSTRLPASKRVSRASAAAIRCVIGNSIRDEPKSVTKITWCPSKISRCHPGAFPTARKSASSSFAPYQTQRRASLRQNPLSPPATQTGLSLLKTQSDGTYAARRYSWCNLPTWPNLTWFCALFVRRHVRAGPFETREIASQYSHEEAPAEDDRVV